MRVDASESALKNAAKTIVQTNRADDGSIPKNVVGDAIAEALNVDTVTEHVLAKDRESRNGISHLQALNAITSGLGYANWNALKAELGGTDAEGPATANEQTPGTQPPQRPATGSLVSYRQRSTSTH